MSRPAYLAIQDGLMEVGDFGRASNIYKRIRDNIAAGRVQLIGMDETEQDTSPTVGSYVELWHFEFYIPAAGTDGLITPELTVWLEAKVSANDGDFRLQDQASSNVGSPVNVTATSYGPIEPELTLLEAWRDTVRTIIVQARQNTSGTAFGRAEDSHASRFDY